ncbi:MAG: adenylate/guanylate cyclase domain-containing protein, partial [Fuerstiella sp.]|nr:adenylate/guanylate cyclase domain-containing protein [Fuerstiella sp.]
MIDVNWDRLSLKDFLQLQKEVATQLRQRFGKELALVFTDVVGSTGYIEQQGDIAGRLLMEQHHTVVNDVLTANDGRLIDTAGDGSFCVFNAVEQAAWALISLQENLLNRHANHPAVDVPTVRCSLHWGNALTDESSVSGVAVNTCARLCSITGGGEICLSESAFQQLPRELRIRCETRSVERFKGVSEPVGVYLLHAQDPRIVPTAFRIEELQDTKELPPQAQFTMGRQVDIDQNPANDVVLSHPDSKMSRRISRRHLNFKRTPDGLVLESISDSSTIVDGREIRQGEQVLIKPGASVQVGEVIT